MKTFVGDSRHMLGKQWSDATMPNIDRDVGMAFDSAGVCDGPRQASNEVMAALSGRPADIPLPAASEVSPERNADRIGRFLAAGRPRLFCDDCIADMLALSHRREANRITGALGKTHHFWRDVGACSACGQHKQVIRHV
jgi:hypothetical protein